MQDTRHFPVRVTLASGSAANGIVSRKLILDTSFDTIIGATVYENTGPGVPYQIQIKDRQEVIRDFVSSKDYIASTSTNHPNDKYFPLHLEVNKSQEVTISVNPLATTTQNLDIELVLILKRKKSYC